MRWSGLLEDAKAVALVLYLIASLVSGLAMHSYDETIQLAALILISMAVGIPVWAFMCIILGLMARVYEMVVAPR